MKIETPSAPCSRAFRFFVAAHAGKGRAAALAYARDMGLFDLFKGGKGGAKSGASSVVQKYGETAANKRAQNDVRQEAIGKLAEARSVEAAAILLKRLAFNIDPSITDQVEKDTAFRGIVAVGGEVIETVRAFAAKAESLSWPMRIVRELVTEDQYVLELIEWLKKWDTEYAKFIDPKVQLLAALEEHKHPAIREAVERFLEDVNEPARFHAVSAIFKQDDPAAIPALAKALAHEESFRIKNKIIDGFSARGWKVPDDLREKVGGSLPPGAGIASDGSLRR